MGEINDHLLEKQINDEQSANNQTLATSMLVLMVRGSGPAPPVWPVRFGPYHFSRKKNKVGV